MDDYEKTNAREWDLNLRNKDKSQKQGDNSAKPQGRPRGAQTSRQENALSGPSRQQITHQHQHQHPGPNGTRRQHVAPRGRHSAIQTESAWMVAEGVKRQEQENVRREPQPLLVDVGDTAVNAAENAWRNHERPAASITVPEELVWRDQQHEIYAKKYGTFVFSDDRNKGGMIQLDIWGEPAAVDATRQAIHNWKTKEMPSKRAQGTMPFSTQRSLLPQQRKGEEKRWHREVMRQRFRRAPPLGTQFGAIGFFHWPVKEFQPHELLGNSYEAFDPIRMECSSYVVFDHTLPGFQVMGEATAVKDALLRIRKACFQITARQIAPVRRYFLHLSEMDSDIPTHVTLQHYERIRRITARNTTSPQDYPGCSPKGRAEIDLDPKEQQQSHEMSTSDAKIAGKMIMLMIAKLHYYRGHLRFRIRLGTFLATHYRATEDGRYTVDDFREMLEQSQFVGEVTPELGDRYSETTSLSTLRAADDLLDPRDSMDHTLDHVKPIFTAVFIIADNAGDMRLEMSWQEGGDRHGSSQPELVELSRTWTRLDRGTTSQSSLIDISLLNLKNSSAWHFELSASHAVDNNRLAPDHDKFANSMRTEFDIAHQQRTDKPFVRWNPYVRVKMLQQRTSYLFALKNSSYTLELTRCQDRVYTPRTHTTGEIECETYEPRWSLEVYHSMWDTLLTRNEHLAVGAMVDWDDDVKTWFPEDDDITDLGQVKGDTGFEQLVTKLGQVEKLVLRSDNEMFGGMEVG